MKNACFITTLILGLSYFAFAQRTPTFDRYGAKVERVGKIRVDLKSNRDARLFRTNLRNAAKAGVNFAGRYVLATWGCGTNCSQSAIIDARNGRVFFPNELAGAGFGFCDLPADIEPLVYKRNSRLLVLNGFKGGDLGRENGKCGIYYLEWTGTRFRQVKLVQKTRTDTP